MFKLSFILLFIAICSCDIIEDLCYCQSDIKLPHFKEKKDKTNPCNVIELYINQSLVKTFNPKTSQKFLQHEPIIKFPGRKLVQHGYMTLTLFKPIVISSLKPKSQQNVYVHWLISQIPSGTSRFGSEYTFNLSPGYEYIEYWAPKHSTKDNRYILAFYHQHEIKDYFSSHRYRRFDHFFNSLGKMIICNIINVVP
eukprot:251475_1